MNAAVAPVQTGVIAGLALGDLLPMESRMNEHINDDGMRWQSMWTQAMTDFRGEDEEQPFADVTVRMTVPSSIGGNYVRAELSNRFGVEPVLIGRGAIIVGDQSPNIAFDGQHSTEIPAGESRWTDPIELTVNHGDDVAIDLYLPEPTPYATANGFTFQRSMPGDFVGSREFPAPDTHAGPAPDGTGHLGRTQGWFDRIPINGLGQQLSEAADDPF
jgi:hypothetical protein